MCLNSFFACSRIVLQEQFASLAESVESGEQLYEPRARGGFLRVLYSSAGTRLLVKFGVQSMADYRGVEKKAEQLIDS